MFGAASDPGRTDDSPGPDWTVLRQAVAQFIVFSATTIVAFVVLLLIVCFAHLKGEHPAQVWNLLLVAAGGFGAGCLLGFIYGTFGAGQEDRFGPVFTAVAAALSGATAIDLARSDSGVNQAFISLALSCGLGEDGGLLVALVLIAFFAPGFMLLYVYKAMLLNLPIGDINRRLSAMQTTLAQNDQLLPTPDPTGGGVRPPVRDPSAVAAAHAVLQRPGAGEQGTPAELRVDALAHSALGQTDKAEAALRAALEQSPHDPRLSFALARILLQEHGREKDAIPVLEDAVRDPNIPLAAWMLLGYARLWDETKLQASIQASQTYLAVRPNDLGAKLNLARAYGRLASRETADARVDAKAKAISALTEMQLQTHPELKARVAALADDDFRAIKDDPAFQALIR